MNDELKIEYLEANVEKMDIYDLVDYIFELEEDDNKMKMLYKYASNLIKLDEEIDYGKGSYLTERANSRFLIEFIKKCGVFMDERVVTHMIREYAKKYPRTEELIELITLYEEEGFLLDSLNYMIKDSTIDGWEILNLVQDKIEKKDRGRENFDVSPIGLPINITIGLEIEAEGITAILLNHLGFREFNEILGMSKTEIENIFLEWKTKGDQSLGGEGVELISTILEDTEQTWKNVAEVCYLLQDIGCSVTENCGGHIHIGTNILGYSSLAWERFFIIWNEAEQLIYKLSNAKGEEIRNGAVEFATKNGDNIQRFLNNGSVNVNCESDLMYLSREFLSRFRSVNLSNLGNLSKNTIEFRVSNGTLDPNIIKENTLLYGSILTTAFNMSINPEYKQREYEQLLNRDICEEEKIRAFLDLIFNDEDTKKIFIERYDSVKDAKIYNNIMLSSVTPKFIKSINHEEAQIGE